jgi:hypothetical protein
MLSHRCEDNNILKLWLILPSKDSVHVRRLYKQNGDHGVRISQKAGKLLTEWTAQFVGNIRLNPSAFWELAPCSWVVRHQHFTETSCLNLRRRKEPSTLKTDETGSLDKLAPSYQTTRSRILEIFYPAGGDNRLLRNIASTKLYGVTYNTKVFLTFTAISTSNLNKVIYLDWQDILSYRSQGTYFTHCKCPVTKMHKWTHFSKWKLLMYKKKVNGPQNTKWRLSWKWL